MTVPGRLLAPQRGRCHTNRALAELLALLKVQRPDLDTSAVRDWIAYPRRVSDP